MENKIAEEIKPNNRINYRQKNLDYIEKIKEKKVKDMEEKIILEKKQQHRRETLKKRILEEASKNRQNKLRELKDIDNTVDEPEPKNHRNHSNFQSLPKQRIHELRIPNQKDHKQTNQSGEKKDYQQRYLNFLQNLHQNIKSKKEIQENDKRKKEVRINKIKQELGFNQIQSKLNFKDKKQNQMMRSHSAQKFQSLIDIAESQLPKTNKNFKKKNDQFIEKIKRKREEEELQKEEDRKKKQRLKEKLKDYVMVTVKKNVLDGAYDDEIDRKGKKKQSNVDEEDDENEEESEGEAKQSSQKKKRKLRAFPHVTDLGEWRKKNRLENNEKVFIITGGYSDLKKALRQRGWVQNPDVHSPCFDLKFTLQGRQIQYDKLLEFQMANHFEKNGVITTKAGLTKSLKSLVWINDSSQDNFYPKCFDLNDEDDYVGFQTHFKICKALSILKIYSDSAKNRKDQKIRKQKQLLDDLKMRTQVALAVCHKNIEDLDEIIDKKKVVKVVTEKEWEILASDELNEEGLAKKKHEEWLKSIDCKFGSVAKKPEEKKKKKKKEKNLKEEINDIADEEDDQEDELLEKVEELLKEYEKRYVQYNLTGHNNIWILKPAGLSRGRGIICYNNFVEIQDHIKCKESLWIAQKYIENPLVVLKRKFDIRQWVLITDFNPLTIWLYDQCYVRFSAIDYDPKQVSNKFIHLTNNSIGANYKDFDKSHIKGNMYFQHEFSSYLQGLEGIDIFEEKIKPQFKQIVKQSMMCALDGIENRKNTHELFGYDFMVDEDYKVWLIEVNSSPAMDYSTHVTAKLVKDVMEDLAKVIVDYVEAPKKERKHVNTGKFRKIYKGIEVSEKVTNAGLNLCLEGIPMKKLKRNTIKVQNFNIEGK